MTLGAQIAQAGYDRHWAGETAPLPAALAAAPPRAAASPDPAARWRELGVDRRAGTIRRPPGVVLDSGGLGKGLAADMVAARLAGLRFIVDVGGDLALGHGGGGPHEVAVTHPLTGEVAHRFCARRRRGRDLGYPPAAVAGPRRRAGPPPSRPSTGRPAWTGLLAATAVGRSALEAEVLAKVALLRGPRGARAVLAAQRRRARPRGRRRRASSPGALARVRPRDDGAVAPTGPLRPRRSRPPSCSTPSTTPGGWPAAPPASSASRRSGSSRSSASSRRSSSSSPPRRRGMRPWHERLAITGLVAIAAHGAAAARRPVAAPRACTGILVPFTMGYRPLWTGLGIIAFYCLAAFGLSFYQRRRIGARRWRSAHRFASPAFVLGGIHAPDGGDRRTQPAAARPHPGVRRDHRDPRRCAGARAARKAGAC